LQGGIVETNIDIDIEIASGSGSGSGSIIIIVLVLGIVPERNIEIVLVLGVVFGIGTNRCIGGEGALVGFSEKRGRRTAGLDWSRFDSSGLDSIGAK
jgi:hypothetical protein